MHRPMVFSWIAAAVAVASVATGCQDAAPELAAETAPIGITVGALAACGNPKGSQNPFADIKTFELWVRELKGGKMVRVDATNNPQSLPLGTGAKSVTFADVSASSDPREVTLVGYGATKAAVWFARKGGVVVKKTQTNVIDMTLMAIEGFTCLKPTTGVVPNLMFTAATKIDNGRVLITGGFSNAATVGTDIELESPVDTAYIFDPGTGELLRLPKQMKSPRAGHSMIYLSDRNQVLIVGGALRMRVKANNAEPPRWKPEDGVNVAYEVYDVTKNEFFSGKGQEFARKRVLPNLMLLQGNFVAVLGGAVWPVADDQSYRESDLYDPSPLTPTDFVGSFVNTLAGLPLNIARAGAALAYAGTTVGTGTARYLVWGGNGPRTSDNDFGKPAERFKESTELGRGEFFDGFVLEGDYAQTAGKPLFFPTLTTLNSLRDKEGKPLDDGRFLSVGGVRYDVKAKAWLPPDPGEVWLLTLTEPTAIKSGRIGTKKVGALSSGIFLHQANPAGAEHVILTGGFSAFGQPATFTMQAFDTTTGVMLPGTALPAAKDFVKRGGHTGLTMSNDCVLLFGGIDDVANLKSQSAGTTDIYCPKTLLPK